jgi:hypothetical protein
MPMPVIINPKNMPEYNEERANRETKHPEFTAVRWVKTKVKEGEALEMRAVVKDIDDGNMVTFQVWKEGQDPDVHIALARIPAGIEGGVAKAVWQWRHLSEEPLPEQDPKFFFSVHSAWCQYKKSGNAVVELRRPELTDPEWKDKDGNSTEKGLVGEAVMLSVSCNEDMEEGAGVIFKVYADGADPKRDQAVAELAAVNKEGKAEAQWTYRYKHDPEHPLTEKPKLFFTAAGNRCKAIKSGNVEMGQYIYIQLVTVDNFIIPEANGKLLFGKEAQNIKIADGYYEEKECTPGDWILQLSESPDTGNVQDHLEDSDDTHLVVMKPITELMEGMLLPQTAKKTAIILDGSRGYS